MESTFFGTSERNLVAHLSRRNRISKKKVPETEKNE